MRVEAIPALQLTDHQVDRWMTLQRANCHVHNPFFSPGFTQAVARARENTEVAVFTECDESVAFLPFQRCRWNIGRPVANRISEIQGIVSDPDFEFNDRQLLRDCGLSAWRFDCVPTSQVSLRRFGIAQFEFPYIDISRGFAAYREERRRAGSQTITQALRKSRKIERELGPLRLDLRVNDDLVLHSFLGWKSSQYRRINAIDLLAVPWIATLLPEFVNFQGNGCSGLFSVLYAGDTPIAAHLGLLANGILAWCFPSYDPAYGGYSPGMVFLVMLLRHARSAGIRRIDLGQGDERYKTNFQNGSFPVNEGSIEQFPISRLLGKSWIQLRKRVTDSPLGGAPLRRFRQLRSALMNH